MDGAARMTSAERLLRSLLVWRWWTAARFALLGVRLNPSAVLLGRGRQLNVSRTCVLGARVRIDAGANGCVRLERGVWLAADTEVDTDSLVHVRCGTTVQRRCSLNGAVHIGRCCILAPNVFISSGRHLFREIAHLPIREQERLAEAQGLAPTLEQPVWIQDDCWLGVNVVVCPGVTVGKGSVVGANSVVTRNVRPFSVVAGSPAREIGQRLPWVPPKRVRMDDPLGMPYLLAGGALVACAPGDGIQVSAAEALKVAIASSSGRALVHYRAASEVEIRSGGSSYRLRPGAGVIDVPVQELMQCGGEYVVGVHLLVYGEANLEVLEIADA